MQARTSFEKKLNDEKLNDEIRITKIDQGLLKCVVVSGGV
jgi:hypothetical protein